MDITPRLFLDLGLVFGAALVGGALAQWMRQPLILGYLIGGILVVEEIFAFPGAGRLMLVAWALGLAELVVMAVFSGHLARALADLVAWAGGLLG